MENPNKINEGIVQTKTDTVANVSALKQAALPEVSNKVQTQIDPQLQKQQDLDTLSYFDYKMKYAGNPNAGTEYVANSTGKIKEAYAKQQKQELADSYSITDGIQDTALGLAAGTVNLVGNTLGGTMLAASDPAEALTQGADFAMEELTKFSGENEKYKEIKDNVNQFLEERGILVIYSF